MLIYGKVKKGDVVVCVDDDVDYGKLTLDKSYEVLAIHPHKSTDDEEWIQVTSDSDRGTWWYYPRHFSLQKDIAPVTEGWAL